MSLEIVVIGSTICWVPDCKLTCRTHALSVPRRIPAYRADFYSSRPPFTKRTTPYHTSTTSTSTQDKCLTITQIKEMTRKRLTREAQETTLSARTPSPGSNRGANEAVPVPIPTSARTSANSNSDDNSYIWRSSNSSKKADKDGLRTLIAPSPVGVTSRALASSYESVGPEGGPGPETTRVEWSRLPEASQAGGATISLDANLYRPPHFSENKEEEPNFMRPHLHSNWNLWKAQKM